MADYLPSAGILQKLEKAEKFKLTGRYEEALNILESILVEDPQNIVALEEIADNELSLENTERAHQAAKQAVLLSNKSYTGHYILGFIYSNKESWEEALNHLRLANELKSNNPEILRCLGWVLFNNGQRAQGIVTLERSLNLDNENPLTLCDLGVAYLQLRNFQKSKSLFNHVLELDPENSRAKECLEAVERLEQSFKSATFEKKVEQV